MGSVKDRNGMDLTEAEDIKKRWQEYTEELYMEQVISSKLERSMTTSMLSPCLFNLYGKTLYKIPG